MESFGVAVKERVIYYSDEQNDDFAENNIQRRPLGKGFKYIHTNIFFKMFEYGLYYALAIPLVYLMQKIWSHQKFSNRRAFKKAKKTGYFIYSNHTQTINDAYIGPLATFPKKCFIIANPDATSIRGVRTVVQALGAIPLPSNISEARKMLECIDKRIEKKKAIMIYPEAHIWPYYTKIRNFPYTSFEYATALGTPIFVMTNCYKKRRLSKKPRITTYVDGPFYPNENLSKREAAKELRNIAYEAMSSRAEKHSTYEYVKYVKKN